MSVLIVVLILFGLIVAHELGHFAAAKWFGIRVDEFGVGYPPRAFTVATVGETVYTINWLPFGGFVSLFGEDGHDLSKADRRSSFAGAAPWKQAIVLVAGVAMNALCAWLLFAGALHFGMLASVDDGTVGARVVVAEVLPNSPAALAGITVGDEILAIHDAKAQTPTLLSPDGIVSYVSTHGGKPLSVDVKRDGVTFTTVITPAQAVIQTVAGRPALGIALASVASVHLPIGSALYQSFSYTYNSFVETAQQLFSMLQKLFVGAPDISGVIGPVGLVGVVRDAEGHGLGYVLELAAVIAINLSIINLLPLPALDGGRLVIVLLEAIVRRKVPKIILQFVNGAGFIAIIASMIAVTYHDILHLIR